MSPVKKSKNSGCEWYDFSLQTSPVKTTRVVAFNMPSHNKLKSFEASKMAVQLKNIKPNNKNELIFNQQSSLHCAANSDVSFDYVEQEQLTTTNSNSLYQAVNVEVADIKTLKPNQKINLNAIISIGEERPKEVPLNKTQEIRHIKEDCVLEDSTGSIMAHIWVPFIDQLKNGEAYYFTNLTIKSYKGTTFVSSSPSSEAKPSPFLKETLEGPRLLEDPNTELNCENFHLISKLCVYSSCTLCHKRLNDVSASMATVKCHNCGTRQRVKDIKRQASVKLFYEGNKCLTAFTDIIEKLLAPFNVTLQSNSDDIEETLMKVEDITLNYNAQTLTIKDIISFKQLNAKQSKA